MIEVTTARSASNMDQYITAKFSDMLVHHTGQALFHEVVRQIAERYVAEHYQDVVALIKPEAIATLVAAEAGAKIRESLEKNIPQRVLEIERTAIFQRGIFGGLKRL